MVPDAEPRSYYDQPVIKPPVWTWEVPTYLFFGGMGGAASALAAAAGLTGRDELARRAWMVSLTGITISPLLLVMDLGRPLRFLNMLRVFKLTSPMSVGSWILIANGAAATPAAVADITGLPIPGARAAKLAAGVLGIPLATYTAVLLTNTAVPVWSEARWTLPFVFAAGAAASSGGAVVAICPPEHAAPARRLAIGGAVVESVVVELMQQRLGELAEPYHEGPTQKWSIAAKTLTMLGGLGVAAFGRRSKRATMTSAAMLAGGAFCERWAVYKAGFDSARDPRYTVGPQRARIS
ncbi:polysulfide reductase NrfD [Thermoleophilia bacterium SCSIO 60948]|nr:polysulfide reductase NrfD [Thermoleophilia bacterium SCSIO 60948]